MVWANQRGRERLNKQSDGKGPIADGDKRVKYKSTKSDQQSQDRSEQVQAWEEDGMHARLWWVT